MNSDLREIVKTSKRVYRELLAFKWIRSHKTATRGCFTVAGEGEGRRCRCSRILKTWNIQKKTWVFELGAQFHEIF